MPSITEESRLQSEAKIDAAMAPKVEPNVPKGKATWTFMLYLAGDNNLDDEMIWTLKEVYRVGVPAGIDVTAQFDTSSRRGVRFYRPATTLDVDGAFSVLHDRAGGEEDSGDPDALVDFVTESVRRAPAENYMLILSGHGSGVIGDFLTDADTERRRSLQPGSLSIPDLTRVFDRLRRALGTRDPRNPKPVVDILGMDSCLMSMAEVCSEVMGQVSLIVGSEGFEPNAGWPYYRLLERLAGMKGLGDLKPEDMARRLVRRYTTYYSDFVDAGLSVDLAVCDVSKEVFGRFEAAVRRFVDGCEAEVAKGEAEWLDSAIVLAHWRAQSYKGEAYTDVYDFFDLLVQECDRLKDIAGSGVRFAAIRTLAEEVKDAVSGRRDGTKGVVVFSDTSGPACQHSHGLSVYFPWSLRTYEEAYHVTKFATRTGWHTFLRDHLGRTERKPRKIEGVAAEAAGFAPHQWDDEIVIPRNEVLGPDGNPLSADELAALDQAGGRTSAPSSRTSAPSSRTSAPSSRTSAPSSRTSAPSSRTSAPSSRFAQDIHVLLQELPSEMKNYATEYRPVVRLDREAAESILKLQPANGSPLQALQRALAKRLAGSGG
jgi:hypothetical protein